MARVAFPLVLQSPVTGSAIVGAKATISKHEVGKPLGSGAAAEIFTTETEATKTASNTITSDNTGRWTQGEGAAYAQYWLPEGTYDIVITGTGLTAVTITRELASGSGGRWESGDLKLSAAKNVPAGWLACEGQAVSRTTYKALFEAVGTAYGEGDKATTFNVPDYRECVPVGAGAGTPRGSKGGEATHKLTEAEMPSHAHAIHVALGSSGDNNWPNLPFVSNGFAATQFDGAAATEPAGGGGAHNNMQPYTGCNVWIKT